MLPPSADVVIVGGGAIGCSIAYHLAKRGTTNVVVIEQEFVGSGTTSKAAGGIRAQFPTETEIKFSLDSIAFFERFEDEMGMSCDYRKLGYLYLIGDEHDLVDRRKQVALQNSFGVPSRIISPQDARELVPQLNIDGLIAAVFCPLDGFAGPNELVQGYAAQARRRGVQIVERTLVTGFEVIGDRVRAVQTNQGRIQAPYVVNAAGPWAPLVGKMVGVDLPIMPRRRHIFVTDKFDGLVRPSPQIIDRVSGFYCRTEGEAVMMSPGDVEDIGPAADFQVPVDWSKLEVAVEKAVKRVPVLEQATIKGGWAGLRPVTADEHAIIDWIPGVEGMLIAGGFNGHGFQHSPKAGQVVVEMILDGRPSMDLSLFSLARFQGAVAGAAGAEAD